MRRACLLLPALCLASTALAQTGLDRRGVKTVQDALVALDKQAIPNAIADPGRPPSDRAKDEARHPADILAFAQVRPGAKVADFIMGGGYWTRLMSDIVGGSGKVYAYQPAEFITYKASYATDQDTAVQGRANVIASRESLGAVSFPAGTLDSVLTVQNWHDLHLKESTPTLAASVAKAIYAALKPGGVLVVVDHVGLAGATPFAVADTLHRGDPAATRKEIEAVGFRYDGALDVLASSTDPHTAAVFDPAIRGHTDQFVYRFRKPR